MESCLEDSWEDSWCESENEKEVNDQKSESRENGGELVPEFDERVVDDNVKAKLLDDKAESVEDVCENCCGVAHFFCSECENSYCQSCSYVRHKHPQRKTHNLLRLSIVSKPVKHISPSTCRHGEGVSDMQEMQMTGLLVKHFQLQEFKSWQLEIIKAVLERRNAFVLQPTGSGKSLCFQFPPLLTKRATIVLTPTLSLMSDQCSALQVKGIQATYLGSTQKDKDVEERICNGEYDIIYTTPEKFFGKSLHMSEFFSELVSRGNVGLIAIDEAHLVYSWKTFRPAFGLIPDMVHTCGVPVMALTATATPDVQKEIAGFLGNCVKACNSMNQPNIAYKVYQLKSTATSKDGNSRYSHTASQLLPFIKTPESRVLIYTNFIKDTAPLAIALREHGLKSTSYHGQEMSASDKCEALDNWKQGKVKVMVCTSAFGMGIDQPDVETVICVGCPPSLEDMVQKFGRAGRNGLPAEGILFYQESDIQQASFWCKSTPEAEVIVPFKEMWKFVLSHLINKCRRKVLLEYFEEDVSVDVMQSCCDVCEMSKAGEMVDCQEEISIILKTVQEIPESGERKISEWIRGSNDKEIDNLHKDGSLTFAAGAHLLHSANVWRILIRQAWLLGLADREMIVARGHNKLSSLIINTYKLNQAGHNHLQQPTPVYLPSPTTSSAKKPNNQSSATSDTQTSATRKGRGSHALPVIKHLMESKERWFPITSSADYHFPGVFRSSFPQRMGYCEDISMLPNYEPTDQHFLFSDIQLGKGKARPVRTVEMVVDGKKEMLKYRIIPCGGVKVCGATDAKCDYVVSTRETRPCPNHPRYKLICQGSCPVEFVYLWPQDESDRRRWQSGIVRNGSMEVEDIHNHPMHSDSKIPAKVDSDIRKAIASNPHLKTSDIVVGNGMNYMPGAASSAANHRGRIKNLRLSTLRDSQQTCDARSYILQFEKDTLAFDKSMKHHVEDKQLDDYASLGHPYLRKYSIESTHTYALCMSPLMSKVLFDSEFIEVDITYKASIEMEYLFNVVAFNYISLKYHVMQ